MHLSTTRESMEFDVVIIGAGPAGLSAAIRLKQLNPTLSVVILEKGAEVGAHILSGAIIDPIGIDTLFPNWRKEEDHPFKTAVTQEHFLILGEKRAWKIPNMLIPGVMSNRGNFVVSLGGVCRWLAQKAERLGVEIYPGFAGIKMLYNAVGAVAGVATGDMGVRKDGSHGLNYTPGIELMGKYVLIGEGACGSLAKELIAHYALDRKSCPQKYGIGIKELWEVDPVRHRSGLILHSVGWPLDKRTTGGSFLYHMKNNKVSVGFVVHLDYRNPYLSPFEEFQRFKTHPTIRNVFIGAKRIAYGARALTEGGWQSVPKLVFPGGALVGCAAGFMNVPRIKGVHNAILSGITAGEHIALAIASGRAHDEIIGIEDSWRMGPIGRDLLPVRNLKPLWTKYGTKFGVILGGFDMWCHQLSGFSLFGTMQHKKTDAVMLDPSFMHDPIKYPSPDNILTFDRLSSIYLSGTHHRDDEPSHLLLKDKELQEKSELGVYSGPSTRYCPAAVYEWIEDGNSRRYVINAQNCIHCKTCDIKDPNKNIEWIPPEGRGGPLYFDM
ncbi:MAG: electron-transferring-flavoprotein dehydrogenase [Candidatus Tokpelaia sp. JSC188]|nr:MAG: electron-transferring-flavoprotein dehydrogenase [Candidatus Tokpelaia sp. JSC188]